MSAIAEIKLSSIVNSTSVITGSATIGVDNTYAPEGFNLPGVARWVNRSGGIALGYPAFTFSVRPPTKTSRLYKVTAKLVLPTMEQTSASTATGIQPSPTKAYECAGILEFLLPERSTEAERRSLFSQMASLFFTTITASDAVPSDLTGSPLLNAVALYDRPY